MTISLMKKTRQFKKENWNREKKKKFWIFSTVEEMVLSCRKETLYVQWFRLAYFFYHSEYTAEGEC